jgi:hypothetical protein
VQKGHDAWCPPATHCCVLLILLVMPHCHAWGQHRGSGAMRWRCTGGRPEVWLHPLLCNATQQWHGRSKPRGWWSGGGYLKLDTLPQGLQLSSGRRRLHPRQGGVPQVLRTPPQEAPQVLQSPSSWVSSCHAVSLKLANKHRCWSAGAVHVPARKHCSWRQRRLAWVTMHLSIDLGDVHQHQACTQACHSATKLASPFSNALHRLAV